MLMMEVLLEVNVVEPVTSLPFKEDAKLMGVPPCVVMLTGEDGLEVMVSCVEVPAVSEIVPETTVPWDDCAAACTFTTVPGVVTWVAVARPELSTVIKPVGELEEMVQVAEPVRFLLLPSSNVPVAVS